MESQINKPLRDRRGRWQNGQSGNPYGRPKKYTVELDDTNPFDFARQQITINHNGKQREVPREAALNYKLFELAMQGRPTALRIMFELIKEWKTLSLRAKIRLDELEYYMLDPKNPPMTPDMQLEVLELRRVVSRGATDAPFGSIEIAEFLRKKLVDVYRKDRQRKKSEEGEEE